MACAADALTAEEDDGAATPLAASACGAPPCAEALAAPACAPSSVVLAPVAVGAAAGRRKV